MLQLLLHLLGDFVFQSHWMAENKTKSSWAAGLHATVYSLPFLLLGPSAAAFSVILLSHFAIDRWRLARHVVWLKNLLLHPPLLRADWHLLTCGATHEEITLLKRFEWSNCSATGYPSDVPPWMAVWLLIAADNTLHLLLNYLSLTYL